MANEERANTPHNARTDSFWHETGAQSPRTVPDRCSLQMGNQMEPAFFCFSPPLPTCPQKRWERASRFRLPVSWQLYVLILQCEASVLQSQDPHGLLSPLILPKPTPCCRF